MSDNPYANLAFEEFLVKNKKLDTDYIFIYKNKKSVIIGKNQNPWLECNLKLMNDEGIILARRLTGGGAVFQDEGNINYSFILDRKIYKREVQFKIIQEILKEFGIKTCVGDKNEITAERKKISGNAFYFGKAVIHHGTLLFNSDLEILKKVLNPHVLNIDSNSIRSNKTGVINISEIIDISQNAFEDLLMECFYMGCMVLGREYYNYQFVDTDNINPEKYSVELDKLIEKYNSKQWIFGLSPSFKIKFKKNDFSWGGISIELSVKNAIIGDVVVKTESIGSTALKELCDYMEGKCFCIENIVKSFNRILTNDKYKKIISDISEWLDNAGI